MGIVNCLTPKNLKFVEKYRERIKESPTMMGLAKKLDTTNPREALDVIEQLSPKEKRVLATLISEINAERKK